MLQPSQAVQVNTSDRRWSYDWDTKENPFRHSLRSGNYTIYAVSEPKNKEDINNSVFDSITFKLNWERVVTIVAAGDQAYKIGDKIRFSGTNSASDKTYLFITGPDLPENGVKLTDFSVNSISGNKNTFIESPVDIDNTWSYDWDTDDTSIGTIQLLKIYTVYSVDSPNNKEDITNSIFGNISIIFWNETVTIQSNSTNEIAETVHFEGVNTASNVIYLFITGPDLPENGVKLTDFSVSSISGDINTFTSVPVDTRDRTWCYDWDTADTSIGTIQAGTYTVYAVDSPHNKEDISDAIFSNVTIEFIDDTTPEVTIFSGSLGHTIGEEIQISGKNSASDNTYLFLTGRIFRKLV